MHLIMHDKEGMEAGIDEYLTKPLNAATLSTGESIMEQKFIKGKLNEILADDISLLLKALKYSDILVLEYFATEKVMEAVVVPEVMNDYIEKVTSLRDDFFENIVKLAGLNETDAKILEQTLEHMKKGEKEATCTLRMNTTGQYSWYRLRMLPVFNSDGELVRILGTAVNVDEYKNVQSLVSNEHIELTSMDEHVLRMSCFNVTRDTVISSYTKYDVSETASKGYSDWIYKEAIEIEPLLISQKPETLAYMLSTAELIVDRDKRREFIKLTNHFGMLKMFHAGVKEKTFEHARYINGEIRWISTRMVLIKEPDSGDLLVFFYTRDINDRKIDEEVVRLVLEEGADIVALVEPKVNRISFKFVHKYVHDTIPEFENGKALDYTESLIDGCGAFFTEHNREFYRKAMSLDTIIKELEEKNIYSNTYVIVLKNGDVRCKQVRFKYIDKEKRYLLFIQNDVTVTYRKEQTHMMELTESVKKAEDAILAKTQFISRISHDIRTPIGAIKNLTEFAKDDVDDKEKLLKDIEQIETSNKYLLSLINDTLDISKADSGKIRFNPEAYPHSEYTEMVKNTLEPLCNEKHLKCIIDNPSRPEITGTIFIDKVRLNQIILNLVSNAVKYTPEGGTITYRSLTRKIGRDRIRFGCEITDTGIGMSQEFQKHMFDEFDQEYNNPYRDKTTTGTGLGLAIVKRMIDLMGGTIEVESEIGKGTKITLYIEVFNADTMDNGKKAELHNEEGKFEEKIGGKILLVEDNDINIRIVKRMLKRFEIEHDVATDGLQGLELFKKSNVNEYDLILMDIQMPVMDGYEATKQIRASGRSDAATVPIIAMTADAFEEARKKAFECGVSGYITKPINMMELNKTIRKLKAQSA